MILISVSKMFCRNIPMRIARKMSETKGSQVDKSADDMIKHVHKLNDLDKRILKFSGHYKNKDIPETISYETLQLARNKARIKLSNYLIAVTALFSVGMMYLGRKSAERGETVEKMNLDWHNEYNKATSNEEIKKK